MRLQIRQVVSALLAIAVSAPPLTLAQEQQPVTFKAQSNLVVVNVAVKDKSGKPITNLKKEDFAIFEDEKAQDLTVFELERLNNDVLPALDAGPRTLIERNAAPAPAKPSQVAGPGLRHQDKRLIGLFFDFSSMPPADQTRAVDSAIKFVNTQMTASDLISIMAFTSQFKVVQEFTADRELLVSTIKKFRVGEASELATAGTTGAEEDDDSGQFTADETEFNIFNTDRKLSALEDAARKMSIYPEKKALVYLSSGVGKTGTENQAQLRATVATAVRSNVSFYPIDTRGLQALVPGGDATTASKGGSGMFSGKSQTSSRGSFHDQQETLSTLAADTRGKAMLDSNDLTLGMTQVQKDIDSYYILGYYSTNAATDGKFRRIRVKFNNATLQAKLDYRAGYYASKQYRNFTSSDKERQLEEALQLGDPVNELALALEVDYFRLNRQNYFVPVSVKIPGSALALTKKGGKESAVLDFIGQVRDKNGRLVQSVRDAITVKLTEEDAAKLGHRNLQYDTGMTLAPGEYTLKFLARENQSGKMGTFETKFVIPDLSDAKALRLSSVIWSNQRDAVSTAVGSADNNKRLIASHPLIRDGQKLVPSITRVFRKEQNMYVYFEVYDPSTDPDRKRPSVAADIVLFQGARKAFESTPIRVTEVAASRTNTLPFQFQFPLAKLAPGQYTCQLNVVDEYGRKFAFPRSSIVVIP